MKKSKITIRVLAEIAIFAALAFALDVFQSGYSKGMFLNGGSIGLAMLPVFVIAYRRGLAAGILCGLIVSVTQMLGGIYMINGSNYEGAMQILNPFFQISLDYLLAYTVVGFAGAFSGAFAKSKTKGQKVLWISLGVVLGGLLKYACHVISGGLFWLDPDAKPMLGVSGGSWLYSFVYNGAFSIPNIIICLILMITLALVYPVFLTPNYVLESKEENQNEED